MQPMSHQELDAAARAQLTKRHEHFMRLALDEAKRAYDEDETPVGAVLVRGETVLALSHNLCEARRDPTAHAEALCMQQGVRLCGGRLTDCTLYVTLEPCVMCAGVALLTRLGEIVFGAFDARAGCCGSALDVTDRCFTHSVPVWGGILEAECAELLSAFFAGKRATPGSHLCRQEADV